MRAEKRLKLIQKLVNEQAEDEGLWFQAESATEAYLQQALRKLHEIIEGKTGDECAMDILKSFLG